MSVSTPEPLDAAKSTVGAVDTYAAGLNQALRHEMHIDPSVLVMGEDVGRLGGLFRVTAGLAEAFPGRVFDTPIAESGFAGMGIGAAMAGFKVVVEIQVIDFLWCAADQIANAGNMHFVSGGQVSVPIVFRGPCGFGTGFGVTHSQHLESVFANRPGVKVVMPSTPADAKGLLTYAIRDPNPVVIFEDANLYYERGELPPDGEIVPIGVARIAREGRDCTIATGGRSLMICSRASEALASEGIEVELIDVRSLKPFDWNMLETSVKKTGRFISAFDGPTICSFGAYLTGQVASRCWSALTAPPLAIGGIDVAGAVARPAEALAGISPERVLEGVRRLLH
jgi:pyruvate dehydrogenase E1 component beta subunit